MSNTFFNPTSSSNSSSLLSRLQNINLNGQNQSNNNLRIKPLPRIGGLSEIRFNERNDQNIPQNKLSFPRPTTSSCVQNQNLQNEFFRRFKSSNSGGTKIFNQNNVNNIPLSMENAGGFSPVTSQSSNFQSKQDHQSSHDHYAYKQTEHYYFTDSGIETIEDLQVSGVLKESEWILYPPASIKSASHLLYGHNDDYKVKGLNDKHTPYMDQELYQILSNRLKASMFTLDDNNQDKYPNSIGAYCDIVPLEQSLSTPRPSISYSLPSQCFKAWSPRTQRFVCLRRIKMTQSKFSLDSETIGLAKQLCSYKHPNIVALKDIFITDEFADTSLVLVYDYHPNSLTMQSVHMSDPNRINTLNGIFNQTQNKPHSINKNGSLLLSEATMRSYLVQITCALQYLHTNAKIASNLIDPAKLIIQESKRIRLNCFGLMEILSLKHNSTKNHSDNTEEMKNDLVNVGNVLLSVGCGTAAACSNTMKLQVLTLFQSFYSAKLFKVISQLIKGNIKTIEELVFAIAPFSLEFSQQKISYNDFLERQILRQMQCDKLFRILCKLSSVLERRNPHDPQWSEVDERYMLKMFRDFVFHQTDDYGHPYLDLSHIVSCLNKLEVGSLENICLVSRDNKTCMIVNYKQVQGWLDNSFNYLIEQSQKAIEEQSNLANIYAQGFEQTPPLSEEMHDNGFHVEAFDQPPILLKTTPKQPLIPPEAVKLAAMKGKTLNEPS